MTGSIGVPNAAIRPPTIKGLPKEAIGHGVDHHIAGPGIKGDT